MEKKEVYNEIEKRERKILLIILIFIPTGIVMMLVGMSLTNVSHNQTILDTTTYIALILMVIMALLLFYELKKRDQIKKDNNIED